MSTRFNFKKLQRRTPELLASVRSAELLYHEVEWLNAWAHILGKQNQQDQLDEGWRLILLNQLPDILTDRSLVLDDKVSQRQFEEVQYIARDVLTESLTEITGQMQPGSINGDSLVVFNPLPWDRIGVIQVGADVRGAVIDSNMDPDAFTADRSSQATQPIIDVYGHPARLIDVRIPSFGYRTYAVRGGLPGQITDNLLHAERQTLESAELRVIFDENGEISSLFDKTAGRETVTPGQTWNQLVTFSDLQNSIDHNEKILYPVHIISDWRVTESGPIRVGIEITRQLDRMTITQRIYLWAHTRRIDFVTEVTQQSERTPFVPLHVLFPFNIKLTQLICEIPFGVIEHPQFFSSHDGPLYEFHAQRWIDLSQNDYGVALLNNGPYTYRMQGNTLGLSLISFNTFSNSENIPGKHRFTYSLFPHAGDWREPEIIRRAYELNIPLRVIRRPAPDKVSVSNNKPAKGLPLAYSFLNTLSVRIVIETIKVADNVRSRVKVSQVISAKVSQ